MKKEEGMEIVERSSGYWIEANGPIDGPFDDLDEACKQLDILTEQARASVRERLDNIIKVEGSPTWVTEET